MAEKNEKTDVEVMTISAVESMVKGEIKSQIDTAHQYPRSLQLFKNRAIEMATIDEETAESCLYHRPVGKDQSGTMKYADGMSIRMAEIVGSSFGNLRVYATLVEQTERQVIARGMAMDLESNFASSSDVIESTVDSKGRPYSERMAAVVAKAALAKARRDATFQVVPRALARPVEAAVRQLLGGEAKSLDKRRAAVTAWIGTLTDNTPSGKFDPKRIWAALGIGGAADLTIEHIDTLTGIRTALKDNETTLNEAFPAPTWKEAAANINEDAKAERPPAGHRATLAEYLGKNTDSAKAAKARLKELTGKMFIANVTEDEAKAALEKIAGENAEVADG